jgi:hypothetical protein
MRAIKKWETFWVSDKNLGKQYKGVELKKPRPILMYSVDEMWAGRLLYIEMSSHCSINSANNSVLINQSLDKYGLPHESWVLTNRIGLIRSGVIEHAKRYHDVSQPFRKIITEKMHSLFSPDLINILNWCLDEKQKLIDYIVVAKNNMTEEQKNKVDFEFNKRN